MPEGHTVHRLARTFDALFAGEPLRLSSPQGRFAAGAALLDGGTLVRAEAWGKHMFLGFGPGTTTPGTTTPAADLAWLRVHLGLYGSWTFAGDGSTTVAHAIGAPRRRIGEQEQALPAEPPAALSATAAPADGPPSADLVPSSRDSAAERLGRAVGTSSREEWVLPEPRGQVRVRIVGEHAVADLTGPSACEVITDAERHDVLARLGPDPIRTDADPERFVARVRRSRTAVGLQLMAQDVVAGVGNIYRAEALFRAGLDPQTPGNAVPAETLREIWDDLVVLMRDGVATGRIVTTRPEHRGLGHEKGRMDPRRVRQNTDGDPDVVSREESFYVYHRDGLACRVCGATILVRDAAGRTLFWCPTCQH